MKIQEKPDYLIFADSAKNGECANFPDVSRGWGVTIDQTASKPPLEWMNGAFNRIDKNALYLLQQGVPEWSEKVIYPANAIIKYNGVLYTAIVENDNAKPSTNTTKWKKTIAEVPTASTKQKGAVKLSSATDSTSETEAATSLAVKKAYDVASGAVKKTGDTMTGQLILPKDGLKINFDNKDIMALVTSNDNYSHVFYNSAKKQWLSKLIYNSTTNAWNFQYVDDVTINNKSILKNGDAIQTFGDLSTTLHLNDLTGSNEGVYYQGRNVSAVIERGYPINEAGTLQVFKNGADGAGCCQIYTTYRNARQFMRNYRGGTKTWEEWSEVITTGNSGDFIKKGDYGIGSFVGAQLENPDETLKGGCYATRTASFPDLQTNRNDSASLIVYPAWTKNWYVEKLAVVQSKTPRIYYRCSTPDGKQPFYEVITSANIKNFCGQSVILYPDGTESKPSLLRNNQRIVIDNPFNTNLVYAWVEFYENGIWYKHDEIIFNGDTGYGTKTNTYANKIVIQTGNSAVRTRCFHDGNPSGADNIMTSLPYRLIIVKIGA